MISGLFKKFLLSQKRISLAQSNRILRSFNRRVINIKWHIDKKKLQDTPLGELSAILLICIKVPSVYKNAYHLYWTFNTDLTANNYQEEGSVEKTVSEIWVYYKIFKCRKLMQKAPIWPVSDIFWCNFAKETTNWMLSLQNADQRSMIPQYVWSTCKPLVTSKRIYSQSRFDWPFQE